ncbi:MAG TPA: M28 family peptidase [Solirubrobacteraceae bacterium]|jgi:hypothetical protein|nr:M28 family peptidase [Solirubrobacteraceae bacterium]
MVSATVLNGRIYRAAFLPLLFALVIAGFSLTERAGPLGSSLAPEAFNGERAFAELASLAAHYPDRRPGGAGDQRLAAYVARTLRALGGTARGGFAVTTRTVRAQTIDGKRTLTTVIAQRPGTTGEAPIVLLAHRDAAGRRAAAELSGTAALLELARVLAASETQRTIVLVSTSGGSGGNAGAADFAERLGDLAGGGWSRGPIDAALVLGDLAGRSMRTPLLGVLSDGAGFAPALLQSTVSSAIAQQTGLVTGAPGTLAQLVHMIFPLSPGEQAPLNAHGLPAALVGIGGEQPPPADEPVSAAHLEGLGRAVLSAVYALDESPPRTGGLPSSGAGGLQSIAGGLESGLQIHGKKAIPGWALRLLAAALLLPVLLVLGDGLARARRRREPVGRWMLWALACALPFLAAGLFAILLGRLGAVPAPYPPVSAVALHFDRLAVEAVLATTLVLVLAWLAWPALMRRLRLPTRPRAQGAGIAMLLVLSGLAVIVWVVDPLTALLLVPALHLWLVVALPGRPAAGSGRIPLGELCLLALGVAPLALVVVFYATNLDLGPGGVVHTALLLLAGGRIGVVGAVLWSVAFGCLAAALLVVLAPPHEQDGTGSSGPDDGISERDAITIRGGLVSYAGPGSLGGTESALRR